MCPARRPVKSVRTESLIDCKTHLRTEHLVLSFSCAVPQLVNAASNSMIVCVITPASTPRDDHIPVSSRNGQHLLCTPRVLMKRLLSPRKPCRSAPVSVLPAAARSCALKLLHVAHCTLSLGACRVSMSTLVWTIMCIELLMFETREQLTWTEPSTTSHEAWHLVLCK